MNVKSWLNVVKKKYVHIFHYVKDVFFRFSDPKYGLQCELKQSRPEEAGTAWGPLLWEGKSAG